MAEKLLRFKDLYTVEYRPGEDELTNYRAYKRKRHMYEAIKMICKDCGCEQNNATPGCDCPNDNSGGPHFAPQNDDGKSTVEALTLQQRMAKARQLKRMKAKIKIGRERAKRKMADKKKLEGRARKQARTFILKKLTKGKNKSELSFARRAELEKRMNAPAVKKRINMLAKRMFKDVRKKEVERKKG
jgi:hypothetical protein|tara:strand:- start:14 stop:574 length:561 start_codon:yes stop_codon:yes gene_type:complete